MAGERYRHLGPYSDWVAFAGTQAAIYPSAERLSADEVRRLVGFAAVGRAQEPRSERRWSRDGVDGEEVSWSVGYGPRTRAWLLRPAGVDEALPAVLALHGHDGFTFFGKEKVADGPDPTPELVVDLRRELYGGRAFANELARRGFAVLCPDAFLWGSRRFPAELLRPPAQAQPEALWLGPEPELASEPEAVSYNRAALGHEHLVAKYCTLLGTTLAGVVAYEDRCAAAYLRTRDDVAADRIGCLGLSGGGCRSALLQATCEDIRAAGVVGMMTTHPALLDRLVASHTWMFFPAGLAVRGDWPDIAAARAPSPLLVQYNRADQLFPGDGMRAAHARLAARYEQVGAPDAYVGEFYDGAHKFDRPMQDSAFAHLERWLGA